MANVTTYRDLEVWQRAVDLVADVYDVTKRCPDEEKFSLTSQTRRAAVSIPSNIAEGHGRQSRADYRKHVSIANGSLKELETQLILAVRLEYARRDEMTDLWQRLQDVGKMLNRLRASLTEMNGSARIPETESRTPQS